MKVEHDSNISLLKDYLFAVQRKLVQHHSIQLQELRSDIKSQIYLLDTKATHTQPASIISKRQMDQLKVRFKKMFYGKVENMHTKIRRKDAAELKMRLSRPARKVRTLSVNHSEIVDNDLTCAAELRAEINLIRRHLRELWGKIEDHKHEYKQELQKLTIENKLIQTMVSRAQGQSKFLKDYLKQLLQQK